MIELAIPGFGDLRLEHAVFDFNGTLAVDGILLPEVRARLVSLSSRLTVHILTADTFGTVEKAFHDLPCRVKIIAGEAQDQAKSDYIAALDSQRCVCFGNGRNDRKMLRSAALGIAVIQAEGASPETLAAANLVSSSITNALDLLAHPKRLTASLRC